MAPEVTRHAERPHRLGVEELLRGRVEEAAARVAVVDGKRVQVRDQSLQHLTPPVCVKRGGRGIVERTECM